MIVQLRNTDFDQFKIIYALQIKQRFIYQVEHSWKLKRDE